VKKRKRWRGNEQVRVEQGFCKKFRLVVVFSYAAIDNQLDPGFCFDDAQVVPQHW
jgi:hypothetical protein